MKMLCKGKMVLFGIISIFQIMLIWAGWAQILIIIRSNSAGFAEKVFVHNFWDKFGVVLALAYVLLPFYLKLDVIKKPD